MFRKLLPFLFLFFIQFSFGQNLVPNPSFELYDTCPNAPSQIQYATGWSSFRNSPDYLNTCATVFATIPNNQFGYQQPLSGNGYVGIWGYASSSFYREIIGVQLTTPLIIGQKYYVSFETVLANNGYGSCANNKIGAKFSTIPYSVTNPVPIDNTAQVYSSAIITDTLNWTRIKGSFIADSTYNFIVLGNLFDDAHTDTTQMWGQSNCGSYYMIENVCVSTDSVYSYNYVWTGVNEFNQNIIIYYFPNPARDWITIVGNDLQTLSLCDVLGRTIFSTHSEVISPYTIGVATLPRGIYFLSAKTKSETIYKKIILN